MDDSSNAATASPYFPMGTPNQPNGDRGQDSPASCDPKGSSQQNMNDSAPLPFKVKEEPPDWSNMAPQGSCGSNCSLGNDSASSSSIPVTTATEIKKEPGTENSSSTCTQAPSVPPAKVKQEPKDSSTTNGTSTPVKQEKLTDSMPQKKKRDRFNGMTEEEVLKRTLPDHLHEGLDIVIIGINPGLTAAYVGHHYAGPGNHFWKCLYLSGLIPEPMNAYDDFKLKELGIGFTNIVERTSRGQADLTRKEIKEGAEILRKKIQQYKPKIAVFNGKGIYEIFCGHKNFYIGRQPEPFPGTDTAVFVMPSSSARCSQLPRAVDKVPFYVALKKLRDYLRGELKTLNDSEVIFPDLELKVEPRKDKGEGQVKTESKSKKDRKRKVKAESEEENSSGPVTPFLNPGMGPMGGGPWGGGGGHLPIPPPPMVPNSQVPTMDTLFGGPPTLVKTEDCRDLSSCGLFPPPQLDGPPFYGGGFPCSWPSAMPTMTSSSSMGFSGYQQMPQYGTGNIPAPTDLSTGHGSQAAFPFGPGQSSHQGSYPMASFNGQHFDPAASPFLTPSSQASSLSPGQAGIPGMGSPPPSYSHGPGFPQYPMNGGAPAFMGGYPQLPGS